MGTPAELATRPYRAVVTRTLLQETISVTTPAPPPRSAVTGEACASACRETFCQDGSRSSVRLGALRAVCCVRVCHATCFLLYMCHAALPRSRQRYPAQRSAWLGQLSMFPHESRESYSTFGLYCFQVATDLPVITANKHQPCHHHHPTTPTCVLHTLMVQSTLLWTSRRSN